MLVVMGDTKKLYHNNIYKYKMYTTLLIGWAILFTFLGFYTCYHSKKKEGFLSPSQYDEAIFPILHDGNNLVIDPKLSHIPKNELLLRYPVFDNSYGQFTNNVKYWSTPDNGKCSPSELCQTLYKNKYVKGAPIPSPMSLNDNARRVNFYASHKMSCPDLPEEDVANCLHFGHKTNSLYL